MKKQILGLLFIVLATALHAQDADETKPLNASSVAFAYDAFAAKPLGVAVIAGGISQDFRNAPDEFAQWDQLQRMLPAIKKKVADAKTSNVWAINIGDTLGRYNFDKMAFPSGLTDSTFIPMDVQDTRYAVRFTNVAECLFVPIEIEAARKFAVNLRQSRDVVLTIIGTVTGGKSDDLNGRPYNIVEFKVQRIAIYLRDGTLLAEKKL